MPGTIFYKIDKVIEFAEKYWYFGDLGQFTYSLKESDKYLVQAKTLFEYQQYLLAMDALQESDNYFQKTHLYLERAKKDGKDTANNEILLLQAAQKHVETVQFIETYVPKSFIWTPEKKASSSLQIYSALQNSIAIRKSI